MLADFESELELLAFPNGRYDEQVDALLLFLDWYQEGRYYLTPKSFSMPIIFPPMALSREYAVLACARFG